MGLSGPIIVVVVVVVVIVVVTPAASNMAKANKQGDRQQGVSTLRLLFPRFCTENGISNPDTGGKYLEGFVQWLPDHLKKIKLDQALNAEDLAEALMKINFGLCTFLTKSRNAGLTVPSQVLSQWHQLSALAEEIAEIDDAQYRQLLGLPANLIAPEAFLETPN